MAASADRLMRGRPMRLGIAAVFMLGALGAGAEPLYKYRDAAGHWVFSDRNPVGSPEMTSAVDNAAAAGRVRLREVIDDSGRAVLVASNPFPSWAQVAYRVEASRNLDPAAPRLGNALLPPGSDTELMALARIKTGAPAEVSFSYQFILGHPGARHEPVEAYRLPFDTHSEHRVSQAYPDTSTHAAVADRYAVDFEMPEGTEVFAARDGVVVDVVDEFLSGGLDFERDAQRANYLRILHDDGTLALYGHLQWRSITVAPGQRVIRGEHIAASGNTGFSSGPHLHFVVQRNRAGAVESVPVTFVGADGVTFSPVTGYLAGGL